MSLNVNWLVNQLNLAEIASGFVIWVCNFQPMKLPRGRPILAHAHNRTRIAVWNADEALDVMALRLIHSFHLFHSCKTNLSADFWLRSGKQGRKRKGEGAQQPSYSRSRHRLVTEYWVPHGFTRDFNISTATWKRLAVEPTGTVGSAIGTFRATSRQDVHAGCIPNFIRNFVPQLVTDGIFIGCIGKS